MCAVQPSAVRPAPVAFGLGVVQPDPNICATRDGRSFQEFSRAVEPGEDQAPLLALRSPLEPRAVPRDEAQRVTL